MNHKKPIQEPIQRGSGRLSVKKDLRWTDCGTVDVQHVGFDATTQPTRAGKLWCWAQPGGEDVLFALWFDLVTANAETPEFRLEMDEDGAYTFRGICSTDPVLPNALSIMIDGAICRCD